MAQDVKLEWTDSGYLDIVFENVDENGEVVREIVDEDALGTAILVSLFTNSRGSSSKVPDNFSRNGFMGTLLNDGDHEGSGLWLLEQSRLTEDTLAEAKEYAKKALQWMVSDGIADSIDVSTSLRDERSIFIYIYLYKNMDLVGKYVTIWKSTVV